MMDIVETYFKAIAAEYSWVLAMDSKAWKPNNR